MMRRMVLSMSLVAGLTGVAVAGTPTFGFVRDLSYGPHPELGLMRCGFADSSGGLYIGDSFDDDIFYAADPLTTDGGTMDILNTQRALDTPIGYGSGWSYQTLFTSGNNVFWATGRADTAGAYNISYITVDTLPPYPPTDPVWSHIQVDTSSVGTLGGASFVANVIVPAVIDQTILVAPQYETGGVQFLTVDNTTGIAGLNGPAIANPNAAGYKTISALYYPQGGVIFVHMVKDLEVRRIDYFTTNGTSGGTSYAGTFAQGVVSTLTVDGVSSNQTRMRAQLAIDPVEKILVAPVNVDGNGNVYTDENYYDVFDIDTISPFETPYTTLDGDDITPAPAPLTRRVSGSAFFEKAGERYLALFAQTRLVIFQLNPPVVVMNGDADNDGDIDVEDATAVYNFAAGFSGAPAGDGDVVAPNGVTDAADADAIVQYLVNGVAFP